MSIWSHEEHSANSTARQTRMINSLYGEAVCSSTGEYKGRADQLIEGMTWMRYENINVSETLGIQRRYWM